MSDWETYLLVMVSLFAPVIYKFGRDAVKGIRNRKARSKAK